MKITQKPQRQVYAMAPRGKRENARVVGCTKIRRYIMMRENIFNVEKNQLS
jgi:hypothetical protein